MIRITDKGACCGCHGCASVCPAGCITMEQDGEGFLYPRVDEARCLRCGRCEAVCPVTAPAKTGGEPAAWAARSLDDGLRLQSSSGGVFSELAAAVMADGGVVFGAAFDDHFDVGHIRADSPAALERLRGSKYVQSAIGQTYRQAKESLDRGTTVLFTGTPCQIAGLRRFLGAGYENLITQDIVCHGVPSPAVWQKYVQYRQKAAGKKLRQICFRDKARGWRQYRLSLEFEDRTRCGVPHGEDLFMGCFLADLCLRPSCHQCAFKLKNGQSDITLADFWGIEKVLPEPDDNRGTSLVLIHTERGRALFDSVRHRLDCRQVDAGEALRYNAAAVRSAAPHPKRDAFLEQLAHSDFRETAERFLRVPLAAGMKKAVKMILRKIKRGNSQ